jgi:exopolyphosphatase/guanosine-5'-triphosphate,3'-diphosphate pyrophosphatase
VIGEREMEAAISLDVGSVRLTERFVRDDPPPETQVREIAAATDEALERAARLVRPDRARTLVGVAGTITTLSAVHLGLPGYDRDAIHHSTLSLDDVRSLLGTLARMTSEERRTLPAMPSGREDVIVAGAVILERIMRAFGFGEVTVSEADILDGLLATLI